MLLFLPYKYIFNIIYKNMKNNDHLNKFISSLFGNISCYLFHTKKRVKEMKH